MINRISFILLTAVLFTAFGCSQGNSDIAEPSVVRREYVNGDIGVVMSYPEGPVLFGDRVSIHLELSFPEQESPGLQFPNMNSDDSESARNLVMYDLLDSGSVYDGNGWARRSVEIVLDPVLPGELVYPAVLVNASESILLEPVSIKIKSAFENPDGSESPRQLSSIYVPEKSNLHLFIIVGAFLLALILTIVLVQKYRSVRLADSGDQPKTKEDLLRDFGDRYFSFNSAVTGNDLKRAFGELQTLIHIPAEHSDYFKKVRYSNEDVDLTYALSLLKRLYEEEWTPEGGDE